MWQDKSCLLQNYNALVHNVLSTWLFLAEENIAVVEKPPYSPNLDPCEGITMAVTTDLWAIQEKFLRAVHRSVAEKARKVHSTRG